MRLPIRVDYALRAAVELAAEERVLTTHELGERHDIPPRFLSTILAQLRTAGLVRSVRGREGGFTLARPGTEISLADVIRAVDGPLALVGGQRPESHSYRGAAQGLQDVWIALRAQEREVLQATTLAQVASRQLPERVRTAVGDPAAWSYLAPVTNVAATGEE